ncbi:monocarboxylate transporter 12-B-like [Amphiura filiformis]|uniref:monocarboxylate transporter 12-B-like n=1 Tax=Amphiura filiformis TaxID=82378 RepID=UPI003B20D0A2
METSMDRGWSWVVLFGVYINMILTVGFIQCIGVFFIEWQLDFGINAQTAGWSSSLALAGFGISGLFSSVISACVSCRWQGFLGGMIVAISLSCSEWITEVVHLYLVMAFIGFGIGVAFTNSIVVLGYYFKERIALANGIGFSGSSLGIFILAPLMRYLNDEYSWRGAMTILGAILGNICVCASLFRMSTSEAISMAGVGPESDEIALRPVPSNSNCEELGEIDETNPVTNSGTDGYEHISELPSGPSKVTSCVDEKEKKGDNEVQGTDGDENIGKLPSRSSRVRLSVAEEADKDNGTKTNSGYENIGGLPSRNSSKSRLSVAGSVRKHYTAFVKSYNIVLSVRFAMMCIISPFFSGLSYYAALLYFVSNAINLGIPKPDAAFLLSIMGICGIIGRLCCGPILDKKIFTPCQFFSLMGGISGASCLLGTLARSYAWLVVFAAILGLTSSICNMMYVLIVRLVVGMKHVKKAFGITVILYNIASLTGIPLIGYVYDNTGDYAMAFYTAGSLYLLNSIVVILDPLWISLDSQCKTHGAQQYEKDNALEVK